MSDLLETIEHNRDVIRLCKAYPECIELLQTADGEPVCLGGVKFHPIGRKLSVQGTRNYAGEGRQGFSLLMVGALHERALSPTGKYELV